MRRLLTSLALLGLAACGSGEDEPTSGDGATASPSASAALADAAPASFAQCKTCHSAEKDNHGLGPSLFGIAGAKAGAVAGFSYSTAMKNAGLTWDDATLDAYIAGPAKKVPGTRMSYAGMNDAAKRAEVIAYLKTLK